MIQKSHTISSLFIWAGQVLLKGDTVPFKGPMAFSSKADREDQGGLGSRSHFRNPHWSGYPVHSHGYPMGMRFEPSVVPHFLAIITDPKHGYMVQARTNRVLSQELPN